MPEPHILCRGRWAILCAGLSQESINRACPPSFGGPEILKRKNTFRASSNTFKHSSKGICLKDSRVLTLCEKGRKKVKRFYSSFLVKQCDFLLRLYKDCHRLLRFVRVYHSRPVSVSSKFQKEIIFNF